MVYWEQKPTLPQQNTDNSDKIVNNIEHIELFLQHSESFKHYLVGTIMRTSGSSSYSRWIRKTGGWSSDIHI